MRCLAIATDHPDPWRPWAAIFNRYLFTALAQQCALSVVSPTPWLRLLRQAMRVGTGLPYEPTSYPVARPRLYNIPVLSRSWNGAIAAAAVARALDRMEQDFDIVLATYAYPDGVAARAVARRLGVPYVLKLGGTDVHSLRPGSRRERITAELIAEAAALLPVSEELAAECIRLGAESRRIERLTSGVDATTFRPTARTTARTELGLPANIRVFLSVGRLEPIKGLFTLVDAFERACAAADGHEQYRLVMIGAGSQRRKLASRINNSRWASCIQLEPPLDHPSIARWMNAADALVVASAREGSPNVIREALACGTAVVSTAVGDAGEWVTRETGLLVAAGDANALADALARVTRMRFSRDVLRARGCAVSWHMSATQVRVALDRAIAAHRLEPFPIGRRP